jgi:hypothetical protein
LPAKFPHRAGRLKENLKTDSNNKKLYANNIIAFLYLNLLLGSPKWRIVMKKKSLDENVKKIDKQIEELNKKINNIEIHPTLKAIAQNELKELKTKRNKILLKESNITIGYPQPKMRKNNRKRMPKQRQKPRRKPNPRKKRKKRLMQESLRYLLKFRLK